MNQVESTWTCDVCDSSVTTKTVARPEGWGTLAFKTSWGYATYLEYDVCAHCRGVRDGKLLPRKEWDVVTKTAMRKLFLARFRRTV